MQCKNHKEEKKLLNCICEVNIDGKMALVSLYDDLPHFEYDLTIDNLKDSITKLRTFIQELKQRIKILENENANFQTVNIVLSKNITSLYKTASNEIQRKDKIIDDLRKCQVVPQPPPPPPPLISKMFDSTNNFQVEKTEVDQLSESKKNTEQIKNTVKKTKVLNLNNNDNTRTIVIEPNPDIPKTIYYKRMCQKLAQQNETIESKKQMPLHIDNTNTADKIIQDKTEGLNNDENVLKEMSTSIIHNESKDIINTTLVICESDITPSDCELDTTPVIQCDNQEKDKENVSTESFFSKLKHSAKLKKKLIITPATIGVQNTHTKTFKCAKKCNQINNLASITQCEITNSPEKQIIKSLNKDTLSTCIKNKFPDFDPKTDSKPLTTDILHNQQLFTSEKNNQIQSINIEVEQFPIRRKKTVLQKDNNSLAPSNVRKRSSVTYNTSPSIDNKFNNSAENVKSLSMNNNRESSNLSKKNNSQYKYNLDTIKSESNVTEPKHSDDNCKSSSKNTSVETSPTNKTVIPSINIEVKQVPITSKNNAIKSDNNTLNKFNEVAQSSCIKDHKTKCDSKTNNKLQLSADTLHNQKLSTYDNKSQIPSINIEVEQFPIRRKKTVIEKDNNSLTLSNARKHLCVGYMSPSIDNESNKSTENVKCLSTNNDRVDGTHTKTFKCAKNLNQIDNLASNTQCEITNLPEKQIIKSLNKDTLSTCFKNKFPDYDPKTDRKQLTTDILHNQQLFTSEKNNQIQSINIEVEQFPIRRKKTVVQKDNNSLAPSNVRKRSSVTYNTSPSIDNKFNNSAENVKSLSMNNNRESSNLSKKNNSQYKYNLDTIKSESNVTEPKHSDDNCKSSSKNTSVETSPTIKTVIPSINIEVEQGFVFRQSNTRKVILHSTSNIKQETKKGRRVQLITIEDHYSEPAPSFNGAKKTDIDLSKKSILIEKVVESSSHFYVPQVKRKRTMNFGSADS